MLDYILSKIGLKKKPIQIEEPKQEKSKKLKQVNYQLDMIYRPMYDNVKEFQKNFILNVPDSNNDMVQKIKELEDIFDKIKRDSNYEIDKKIWGIKVRVCFNLNKDNLSILLDAINIKINELKEEIKVYE